MTSRNEGKAEIRRQLLFWRWLETCRRGYIYREIPTNLPSRSIHILPRKDRLKNCWRELSPAAKNLGSTVRRPKQQRDTAGELVSKKAQMPRQVSSRKEKRRKSGKPAARCDVYIPKAPQPHVPEAFRFSAMGGTKDLLSKGRNRANHAF